MTDEVWKPVPGYEGEYAVSDHGRVRSLDRVVIRSNGAPTHVRERVLRPGLHKLSGKRVVALCRDGAMRTEFVHRLVLSAFVGPCPAGHEACHRDDDGLNNSLSNLYWGTRSENMHDRVRNGRHHQSRKTHCVRGHEFTPENTMTQKSGRLCRTCHYASNARVRESKRI